MAKGVSAMTMKKLEITVFRRGVISCLFAKVKTINTSIASAEKVFLEDFAIRHHKSNLRYPEYSELRKKVLKYLYLVVKSQDALVKPVGYGEELDGSLITKSLEDEDKEKSQALVPLVKVADATHTRVQTGLGQPDIDMSIRNNSALYSPEYLVEALAEIGCSKRGQTPVIEGTRLELNWWQVLATKFFTELMRNWVPPHSAAATLPLPQLLSSSQFKRNHFTGRRRSGGHILCAAGYFE